MRLLVIILFIITCYGCNSSSVDMPPEDRIMEQLRSEGHDTGVVEINIVKLSKMNGDVERIKNKYKVVHYSKEEIFTGNIRNLVDIMIWSDNEIKFMFIDESGKTSIHKIIIND